MNKNINLKEILKDCPIGYKLYTPLYGEVEFQGISDSIVYPIATSDSCDRQVAFTEKGYYHDNKGAECLLFPSKTQRDWDKFKAPWLKKKKFDPKTLQPFDKVLVRDCESDMWKVDFYSHKDADGEFPYVCIGSPYTYCIFYNDDTKHLVGTKDEPSDYYRYWKD